MARVNPASDPHTLAAWRRVRRWRVGAVVVAGLLVVAVLGVADRWGAFGLAGADRAGVDGRWADVASVGVGHGAGPVVRLSRGVEIGLMGLADAPGLADAAADAVRAWIGDGPVRVRFARSATRDGEGHQVAYVEAAGGVRLNERLLARGLAVPDPARAGASPHPEAERYARGRGG